jgi:hypothetical protein
MPQKAFSPKPKGPRSADWNYGGPKWRLSRSKIDLFMECQRCFYLDNKLGIARPRGPSFTLNVAVDELLKKEFDMYRVNGTSHPLVKAYGLDAVPYANKELDIWRNNFEGISYAHKPTGFMVAGAIDDVWVTPNKELIIVDYKATSKKEGPASEDDLYDSYKRQMEVYQWLFRKNEFTVSPTGYFFYVNGKTDREAFDAKLEFDITLIPYTGSDVWIEPALLHMKATLESDTIPPIGTGFGGGPCEFCTYREAAGNAFKNHVKNKAAKK